MISGLIFLYSIYLLIQILKTHLYYRIPKITVIPNDKMVLSPVEGKIVYIRKVNGSDINVNKKGQLNYKIKNLSDNEYYQIGIYMSPYNSHFVYSMDNSEPIDIMKINKVYDEKVMINPFDIINLFKKLFYNWYDKDFISNNSKLLVKYKDIINIITFDKFVSQYRLIKTYNEQGRYTLLFIEKGSQIDILLPVDKYKLNENIPKRVSINTKLGEKYAN